MKNYSIYCAATVMLLTASTSSFGTTSIPSTIPSTTELRKMILRSGSKIGPAYKKVQDSIHKVAAFLEREPDWALLLDTPGFILDLIDVIDSSRKLLREIVYAKDIVKEVKGETWQQSLVEEPALIGKEEDDLLLIEQPKEQTFEEVTCPLNGNGTYEFVIDDFEDLE